MNCLASRICNSTCACVCVCLYTCFCNCGLVHLYLAQVHMYACKRHRMLLVLVAQLLCMNYELCVHSSDLRQLNWNLWFIFALKSYKLNSWLMLGFNVAALAEALATAALGIARRPIYVTSITHLINWYLHYSQSANELWRNSVREGRIFVSD